MKINHLFESIRLANGGARTTGPVWPPTWTDSDSEQDELIAERVIPRPLYLANQLSGHWYTHPFLCSSRNHALRCDIGDVKDLVGYIPLLVEPSADGGVKLNQPAQMSQGIIAGVYHGNNIVTRGELETVASGDGIIYVHMSMQLALTEQVLRQHDRPKHDWDSD